MGLGLTAAMVALKSVDPYPLRLAELKYYDWRYSKLRGPRAPTGRVVICAIDEKSIDELGRWPWPRHIQADLLKAIKGYGAVAIGYDVIFSEPDDSGGLTALQAIWRDLRQQPDTPEAVSTLLSQAVKEADRDRLFADVLQSSEGVVMGYFFHMSPIGLAHLGPRVQEEGYQLIRRSKYPIVRQQSGASDDVVKRAYAVETGIAPIAKAAPVAGHFNFIPDEDGALRWIPLVIKYRDQYFPPLPLQMLRQYLKATGASSALMLDMDSSGIVQVKLGPWKIPTDERGWMLINYLGPRSTLPHISATDIYHRRLPDGAFRDRMVIVGATAAGIYDLRVTPFDSNMPGPEIHGTVIENILGGSFITRPQWVRDLDYAAIILFGLLISAVAAWSRAHWSALLGLVVVAGTLAADRHLFLNEGIWMNVTSPLLTIVVAFVGITLTKYLTEEKEKRFYRSAFGHYLSPKVIERIVEDPSLLSLGGERKVLTACFTDLDHFTSISEQMNPEQLVEFLNQYLTAMTEIILGYEGTVDKFEGDAIIAFYGAPIPLDDHPRRACLAALDMQRRLAELRAQWSTQGLPALSMRVGLHTGPMVVGNMGSHQKMDYTIIGDAVNLTARLERVTKVDRPEILVSEA
ncbi:MAG: CHASE2 domain-containing protein, partial [Candidatus Tectimicrobiota bacterium]